MPAAGEAQELAPLAPAALQVAQGRLAAAEGDAQVRTFGLELARYLGPAADAELAEYERMAVLGVCAGFVERQLSPYVAEHVAIVPLLLEEIRGVYAQAKAAGGYDPREFRLRAFHYGLHKASYLDWRLYLSKECY